MPLMALLLVTPAAVADMAASTASAPTGVRTTARREIAPAATRGVLAWSQNSRGARSHYNLYVKRHRHAATRVNRRGTQALTGDFDGSTLAYFQWSRHRRADISFLNIRTGRRRAPAGVNTRRNSEVQPSKDGRWLMFNRTRPGGSQRIILHNLASGRQRLLVTGNGGRRWAQAGEVGGSFLTYVKCHNPSYCNVFRYNIATRAVRRVPNPRHRALYAASVTGDGTVYYAIGSEIACPRDAGLWKLTPHGRKVKLATLGPRFDIASTSPVVMPNGSVEVFFDAYGARRASCGARSADIYKVTVR
jgi:Tol biopolymer transport system component